MWLRKLIERQIGLTIYGKNSAKQNMRMFIRVLKPFLNTFFDLR